MIPTGDATAQPALKLTAAQIGRCGELLVQYCLLSHGIESAAMTTDAGIDLVAYSPAHERATTIQVKSNLRAKPSGGRGPLALDWTLAEGNPAELIALVDLSRDKVWLFRRGELDAVAQQRSSSGRIHFYFSLDSNARTVRRSVEADFTRFELENRIGDLFLRPLTDDGSHLSK